MRRRSSQETTTLEFLESLPSAPIRRLWLRAVWPMRRRRATGFRADFFVIAPLFPRPGLLADTDATVGLDGALIRRELGRTHSLGGTLRSGFLSQLAARAAARAGFPTLCLPDLEVGCSGANVLPEST